MAHQSADRTDPPDPTAGDPPDPADGEPTDPSQAALRAFVRARDRDDAAGMGAAWLRLLELEMPRVTLLVAGRRHDALDTSDRRIPHGDRADVEQRVWLRLHDWLELRGSSIGEFRAILRNAVGYAFRDYVREYVRIEVGRAGSLDDDAREHDDDGGHPAFVRRVEGELGRRAGDPLEAIELGDAVDAALLALPEAQARVVVLRVEGHSSKEIAAQLGLTPANVDQLYSRGRRRLKVALEDYR